ncbi:unnamed protein product [Arctogadus glacialis]
MHTPSQRDPLPVPVPPSPPPPRPSVERDGHELTGSEEEPEGRKVAGSRFSARRGSVQSSSFVLLRSKRSPPLCVAGRAPHTHVSGGVTGAVPHRRRHRSSLWGPARGLHRSGTEAGSGGDLMKTVEGKGHGTNTESMARYSLDSEHCSLLSL